MNAPNHREAQDSSSLKKFLIWTWLRCGIKGCPFSEKCAQKQHFVGSEKIQLIHTYGNSWGHPNPLSSSSLPLHKLQKYQCESLPRQNASQRQRTKLRWGPALPLPPLQPWAPQAPQHNTECSPAFWANLHCYSGCDLLQDESVLEWPFLVPP